MIVDKNIHEKLIDSIQEMAVDLRVNLPYYANFLLFVSFHEDKNIPTCGVNMTAKGMNYYYNSDFLNTLSQKEVNFVNVHECFHLLWNHPKRTISGQYDHKLSNIAQDMIINHVIVEDLPNFFVEIPKDKEGKNMALFVPKEYKGELIFEELYEWLRDEKEKREKNKKQGQGQQPQQGQGQQPQQGQSNDKGDGYGPNGKNPRDEKGTIDTWSLDHIFDNIDNNDGQYLDVHLGDDIPEELRDAMIKDSMERLKARGLEAGNIEKTINKLRKKRKDYLKYIKRSVSNLLFGTKKNKTIIKPNRRQIEGLKGHKKIKTRIVCILDVSGSMWGLTEKVLNYIYRNDIEVILIQADTEVKDVGRIKSMKDLEKKKITGGGGTLMKFAIEHANENYAGVNILLLTDGYHENLDFSKTRSNILIVSAGVKSPIAHSNGKIKQILVDNSYS
jgi:predicted metal-dependent peptidase